jgi:hypothetical protein
MLPLDTIRLPLNLEDRHNKLQQILSPTRRRRCLVYQDTWFHMGTFEKGFETTYVTKKQGHMCTLCIKR